MPLLFTTLLGLELANTILRPIAASLKVSESRDRLAKGELLFVDLRGQRLLTTPMNAALWSKAIIPSEMAEFDEARRLYELYYSINPSEVEKHVRVI